MAGVCRDFSYLPQSQRFELAQKLKDIATTTADDVVEPAAASQETAWGAIPGLELARWCVEVKDRRKRFATRRPGTHKARRPNRFASQQVSALNPATDWAWYFGSILFAIAFLVAIVTAVDCDVLHAHHLDLGYWLHLHDAWSWRTMSFESVASPHELCDFPSFGAAG